PTDIQRELIPVVLKGLDAMGQARTGTGKTVAFGLPISQMADPGKGLQAVVLTPTRELAVQVAAEILRVNEFTKLRCVPVYGGQKIAHQLHLLGRKPCIVVGTPGRMLDLLGRRALNFENLRVAVLDEVDRMLDIGFRDDIRRILSQIKPKHQTIFVSATLDDEIKRLAWQFMTDPVEVNVSRDELTVEEVAQAYFPVERWDKFRLLHMLIERDDPKLAIIFCNTKHAARKLAKRLHQAGLDAKEIHGDLVQQKRDRVMDRFRKHKLRLLVATDLAARGIDVQAITHIINYDIPMDPENYVHRIGRTARMGAFGRAYTLVSRDEGDQLTEIEKLINKMVPRETLDGFEPSPPPRESMEPVAVTPLRKSRFEESLYGSSAEASATAAPPAPKTLGSKFRPARRRRR
ncbi:MAG: DEAD/DEAH box helicase, partial [Phycisphaerae bacterium]|nr:DEAD/DEAH box helicase [Phycisphaerae bacterium]